MRRRRTATRSTPQHLADETGKKITFATPGAATVEERRRYALAVQRATTPPPVTPEQQAAASWRAQRQLDLRMDLERQRQEGERRASIFTA